MKYFLMSTLFNKETAADFGLVEKDGRFFRESDNSEWIKCSLYDFGWGDENGFYKLPLGDFYELINIVLTGEKEDSFGAAAIIMDRYNDELKDFLIELMDKNPSNKSKKLLFDTFKLKWGTNRTAKNGMYIQEIEKEAHDWEKIKEFYSK